MNKATLSDGTVVYWYLEDAQVGRVVNTLVERSPGFCTAFRQWYSDPAAADKAFAEISVSTLPKTVDFIKKRLASGGEVPA